VKIPNQITLARLILVAIGLVLIAVQPGVQRGESAVTWWAFGFLFVGATTDFVDGWVARRIGQVSKLGRMLDPLVDKILICGTLILLAALPAVQDMLPAWVVVLIVLREVLVTSVRGMVEASGKKFAADRLGKWKMLMQSTAVLGLVSWLGGWDWVYHITVAAIWISLVLTVVSGANYMRKAWHVLEF